MENEIKINEGTSFAFEKVIKALLIMSLLGLTISVSRVYFVADDLWCIEKVMKYGPAWAFDPDVAGRLFFRPLTQDIYFRVLYNIFGLSPVPFHLVNMLIYALNTFLVIKVSRKITSSHQASIWAGLLYVLSPLNFLPIAFISGIQEVSLVALALGVTFCFLKTCEKDRSYFSALAGPVLFMVSLFAKESAIWLPLWLLVYDIARQDVDVKNLKETIKKRLPYHLPYLIIMAGYLAFRLLRMPPPADGEYALSFFGMHVIVRFSEYMHDILNSLGMFCAGRNTPWFVFGLIVPAGISFVFLFYLKKRKIPRPVLLGVLWFFMGLAMFLAIKVRSYPYYIQLASIGVFWGFGMMIESITNQMKPYIAKTAVIIYLAILVINSAYCHIENYKNDFLMRASRSTEDIHKNMKKKYPELPSFAKVILLTNIRVGGDESFFGIRALYDRPDLPVYMDEQAYIIERKGVEYLFHPKPGFDFSGAFVFAYAENGGFQELAVGPGGQIELKVKTGGN